MVTRKLSVTVDEGLVNEVQGRVGPRGLSRFVNRAIRHELERQELKDLLAELEGTLGPPDQSMMGEAGALFDVIERPSNAGAPAPQRRT